MGFNAEGGSRNFNFSTRESHSNLHEHLRVARGIRMMAYPNATIYECGERGIHPVAYEETEHYRVMHDFIANPKRMLDILMER